MAVFDAVAGVQPRGGVDEHRAGIDFAGETQGRRVGLRDDRAGMARTVLHDVGDGVVEARHHLDVDRESLELFVPIPFVGRFDGLVSGHEHLSHERHGFRAADDVDLERGQIGILGGPAGLGVASVDVGSPMWAMHSIRESAGVQDHEYLIKVLKQFFVD